MQNDVFISYSRKDSPQVNSLINRLKREIPGINIWYDINGIESAADFQLKIIKAIDESKIVIFVCSDCSLNSEYCRKEILYAQNTGKRVIPFLLPGTTLKGWLLFEFVTINCIYSQKEEEVRRMISDLTGWIKGRRQTVEDHQNGSKSNRTDSFQKKEPNSEQSKDKAKQNVRGGSINGHQYVDLGLPSGLKWATCNVGASRPEEYGGYFAWGEIKYKFSDTTDNSETYKKDIQWLRKNGYIGGNGYLMLSHDVARQNWGGSWRMPTLNEIKELIAYTLTEWTTRNGVKGRLLKSMKNGNCIFLPAAGWHSGTSLYNVGKDGCFWSSVPHESNSEDAYYLSFNQNRIVSNWYNRYSGRSVRPVSE